MTNKEKIREVVFRRLIDRGWKRVRDNNCVLRKGSVLFVVDYIKRKETIENSIINRNTVPTALQMHHDVDCQWHLECNGNLFTWGKFQQNLYIFYDLPKYYEFADELNHFIDHIDRFTKLDVLELLTYRANTIVTESEEQGIVAEELKEADPLSTGFFKAKGIVEVKDRVYKMESYNKQFFYCKELDKTLQIALDKIIAIPIHTFIEKCKSGHVVAVQLIPKKQIIEHKSYQQSIFHHGLSEQFYNFNLSGRQLIILNQAIMNGIDMVPFLENTKKYKEQILVLDILKLRRLEGDAFLGKNLKEEQLNFILRIATNDLPITSFVDETLSKEQLELLYEDKTLIAEQVMKEYKVAGYADNVLIAIQKIIFLDGYFNREYIAEQAVLVSLKHEMATNKEPLLEYLCENGVISSDVILLPVIQLSQDMRLRIIQIFQIGAEVYINKTPLADIILQALASSATLSYRNDYGLLLLYKNYYFKVFRSRLFILDSALQLIWQVAKVNGEVYYGCGKNLLSF